MMKQFFFSTALAALSLTLLSCGKQQSDADRQAEVDRQVQQRLDAEHQTEAQQKLDQRQAELDGREQTLAAKENQTPTPTAAEATAAPNESNTEADSDTSAVFYRKLEPYGDWMETSTYGYVFQPRPAAQSNNWRPYSNGHWVYTDAGWTWISEEKFGWATDHYGRWARLRSVGWVWVPGDEWAPAWVSWRKGNDYVGWAPLPPDAHFDRQTGIRNWADSHYNIGPQQYNFVPANEFGGPQSSRVIVPAERNVTIINQTTNVTNITYNNSTIVDRGPSYDDLHARSRYSIQRLRLERSQNLNDEQPVFRGEVVAMPTRDFRPAQKATRPRRVQRTIAQPTVERGWEGIRDHQAAQKARAKIQSETAAPAKQPAQKVVRPTPPPVASATPPPPTAPTATSAPSASAAPSLNPRQEKRRERLQERKAKQKAKAEASASPEVSPSPTAAETPARKNRHPGPRPQQP